MTTLDGEGVRVVLVGTGSHAAGSRLPDVPAVAGTVRALKSCLLDVCGVREGNLVSLLNPDGPEPFLDEVIAAASAASDVLLLYYVGHGAVSVAGELHLATRATVDLAEKAAYQALPYSEIIGVLVNCRARLVVVVLDCCYSGRAHNPVRSGALLGSADYDEQALAPGGEPYTAFSGELIRALREGVPTAPSTIKLQHLHDHLSRTMRARNRPVPILQTGNLAGQLVLAPNLAYRPDEDVSNPGGVPSWEGMCPYRGLDPFTADDEHVFYGRADLIDQVIHRLGERVRRGGMTVVAGPSGSGKTSLLSAGILPKVLHGSLGILGSAHWPHLSMTPGDDPLSVLAAQLAQLGPGAEAALIRAELAAGPERARAAVSRTAATAYPASPGVEAPRKRLVIVVDQFEELFTLAVSDIDRRAFIT
ncbi:MAG TPA: AAA family ATPase, partial [Pseudonocardiaceae bacterium]